MSEIPHGSFSAEPTAAETQLYFEVAEAVRKLLLDYVYHPTLKARFGYADATLLIDAALRATADLIVLTDSVNEIADAEENMIWRVRHALDSARRAAMKHAGH